jgi:hypothetical protein
VVAYVHWDQDRQRQDMKKGIERDKQRTLAKRMSRSGEGGEESASSGFK